MDSAQQIYVTNQFSLWNCTYKLQSVLSKGRSFTANSSAKAAVLPKGMFSTANLGTKIAVLLWMNRYDSFPLLSIPHSLFSIWTDLKKYEKIPRAPSWRWGEWFWLTGPAGLNRNSQGLNISSIRFLTRPEIHKSQSPSAPFPKYGHHN